MKISENRRQPDGEAMPKIEAEEILVQAISPNKISQQYRKFKCSVKRIHSFYNELFNYIPYTLLDSLWFLLSVLICLRLMSFLR